jgi:hypothetical protein
MLGSHLANGESMMSENQDSQGENLPSAVSQKAMKILKESGNCAQTPFAILNEEHDLEGDQILQALTPFPGIIAR